MNEFIPVLQQAAGKPLYLCKSRDEVFYRLWFFK